MRSTIAVSAALVAVLAALAGPAAAATVGLAPPRSRLARELTATWAVGPTTETIRTPGVHELTFPCAHQPGASEKVILQVQAAAREAGRSADDGPALPTVTAQDREALGRLARKHDDVRVTFSGRLTALSAEGADLSPVRLLDGTVGRVAVVFRLDDDVYCHLAVGNRDVFARVRAAAVGDTLYVTGRIVPGVPAGVWLYVDEVSLSAPRQGQGEPPWTVSVRTGERWVPVLSGSGAQQVALPCSHVAGQREVMGLRLREMRIVDVRIGRHTVHAELADTDSARLYGLQGRQALADDEGMLFFWPEPERPRFVIKRVPFPIAVAFIRADGTIACIDHLRPGDGHVAACAEPVHYVLEVADGWFRSHRVAAGATVEIP